jgi:tetratricopeptide (TPR) repeat protein
LILTKIGNGIGCVPMMHVLPSRVTGSRWLLIASLLIAPSLARGEDASLPVVTPNVAASPAAQLPGGMMSSTDGGPANAPFSVEVRVAQNVDAEYAKLVLPTITVEPVAQTALLVRDAIKRGDYGIASKISDSVLAKSQLRRWHFYPFASFVVRMSDPRDPTYATHLDEWVAHDPQDAMPLLLRAQLEDDIAWFWRGIYTLNRVSAENMRSFERYRAQADDDIQNAIRLNPDNPFAYYMQLRILHGDGPSPRFRQAFERAIAKYPNYYSLYKITLETLQPRWGGSMKSMAAFVDYYAGPAPADSPLKLLYLNLYRLYLSSASFDCSDKMPISQCVMAEMRGVLTSDLDRKMEAAWHLYDVTDKYEFGDALEPIVSDMIGSSGGEFQVNAFLQKMLKAMHSNLDLTQEGIVARVPDANQPWRNDYMIDKLLAASWLKKGFYVNALAAAKAALQDVALTTFPDESTRNEALAGIYEQLSDAYEATGQLPAQIATRKAAIALVGPVDEEQVICHAYRLLQAFVPAEKACDQAIEQRSEDMTAYYERGLVRLATQRMEPARKDMTTVAESSDWLRSSAVVMLSVMDLSSKDFQGAIDVLNRYPFVYDPDTANDMNISIAYGNRCSAYMELGELQKALEDCEASLMHLENPDVRKRKQEIEKKLGQQPSGTVL